MWGRVSRSHGNSGVVKAKFRTNIPAHAFGASCRIVSVFSLSLSNVERYAGVVKGGQKGTALLT